MEKETRAPGEKGVGLQNRGHLSTESARKMRTSLRCEERRSVLTKPSPEEEGGEQSRSEATQQGSHTHRENYRKGENVLVRKVQVIT